MASSTQTYLQNPTILIGILDVSAFAQSATLTVGYDALESTSFGDSGHLYVKGLQTVSVDITFYGFYGTVSTENSLFNALGTGTTTLTISPAGTSESATNPEYIITNAMLSSFTPINGSYGELATFQATFTGGTFARDVTP
jgi:hypothetical protein